VGYRNVEPGSIMLWHQKELVNGGKFLTTFLVLQVREKAKICEEMIDTTEKLARYALKICVILHNTTRLVILRWI
jgi:hypothetical protein